MQELTIWYTSSPLFFRHPSTLKKVYEHNKNHLQIKQLSPQ